MENSSQHKLQKVVWTEEDFENMGWHDATIYAVSFLTNQWELVFDIDYLVEWVSEGVAGAPIEFWVAPATLVFENVNGLKTNYEIWTGSPLTPSIMDISRSGREYNLAGNPWEWTIELEHGGKMEFHASGFRQFFRANPIFQKGQQLEFINRGGISFDRPTKI
jgi:hypothetical protein